MQVKTYTGTSTSAVLAAIKADLGPEAVILDTRESKENGKTKVTVTAALDRSNGAGNDDALLSGQQGAGGMPPGWRQWQEEWSTIKHHLLSIMKPELRFEQLSPRQRLALEFLEREGVDDEVLLTLQQRLLPEPGASILAPLGDLVPVRAWGPENWPQRVHLLAGPFGVGKTTVAMRLALCLRKMRPGSRICLANADADRGGGRLLLKNYAELSDMEYREVRSKVECAAVLAEAASHSFDNLIVDLPSLGRGNGIAALLAELGLADPAHALHLVLSPQYGPAQFRSLLARYLPQDTAGGSSRREGSLVWTKLDEVEQYGSLVNISASARLPVSALSFGPGLRNTLTPARDAALWRLVFKRELPQAG